MREALDATRDAVLILDADTLRFTYANEGATEQVGYTRDELLRMTMLHITPEFTERDLRELLGPLARGEQSSLDVHHGAPPSRRHRPSGRDPHASRSPVTTVPRRRYVKIARDVRERLETEERLQPSRAAPPGRRGPRAHRPRPPRHRHPEALRRRYDDPERLGPHRRRRTRAPADYRRRRPRRDHPRDPFGHLQPPSRCAGHRRCARRGAAHHRRRARGPGLRAADPLRRSGRRDRRPDRARTAPDAARGACRTSPSTRTASSVEIVVDSGNDVTLRVVDNGRGMPASLYGR